MKKNGSLRAERTGEMEKVLLIVNPKAGMMRSRRELFGIIRYLNEQEKRVSVHITRFAGDAEQVVRNLSWEHDAVIGVGGDGTLNEVVNGVMRSGTGIPVGYIPAGSTNDFANTLKLSKNHLACARNIVNGGKRQIDIGRINDRYFTYIASFGVFTGASYNAPQNIKNTLGHLAYLLEGIKDITNIKPQSLKITMGEQILRGNYIFGAIMNTTSIGGIVRLDDELVQLNDGLFEFLLVKAPSKPMDLSKILLNISKQNFEDELIRLYHAPKVEVEPLEEMLWSVDGECHHGGQRDVIENVPGAIELLL